MTTQTPPLGKIGNPYATTLHAQDLYASIPKAVLGAIAVSLATCGGDYLEHARERVVREWHVLHLNGIVPQAVPAKYRHLLTTEEQA